MSLFKLLLAGAGLYLASTDIKELLVKRWCALSARVLLHQCFG
jgi:hypothetical protein